MITPPPGRRPLRLEVRNAQTPVERKPPWTKAQVRTSPQYCDLQARVQGDQLHTVYQEAACPNIFECWEAKEATFLIADDQCTRRCDFCQIDTGRPAALDRTHPAASLLRYSPWGCATPSSPK